MNDINRRASIVIGVVLVIMLSSVAAAASLTASSGVSYEADSGLEVQIDEQHDTGTANPFTARGDTVDLNDVRVRGGDRDLTVDKLTASQTTQVTTNSVNKTNNLNESTQGGANIALPGNTRDNYIHFNGSSDVRRYNADQRAFSTLSVNAVSFRTGDVNVNEGNELIYQNFNGKLAIHDIETDSNLRTTNIDLDYDFSTGDYDDDDIEEIAYKDTNSQLAIYDYEDDSVSTTNTNASDILTRGADVDDDGVIEIVYKFDDSTIRSYDPDSGEVIDYGLDAPIYSDSIETKGSASSKMAINNNTAVYIYDFNEQKKTVTSLQASDTDGQTKKIAAGDFDGDGDEELAGDSKNFLQSEIYDPDDGSTNVFEANPGDETEVQFSSDFDGDGADELVFDGIIHYDPTPGYEIEPTDGQNFRVGGVDEVEVNDNINADDGSNDVRFVGSGGVIYLKDVLSPQQRYGWISGGDPLYGGEANADGSVTLPTDQSSASAELILPSAPSFDNNQAKPQGGTTVSDTDVSFVIPLNDDDFSDVGGPGDEVTVELYIDGEKRAQKVQTSSGQVQFTETVIEGGPHTWHVRAKDAYGTTARSNTFDFGLPGKISVFREDKPSQLINTTETPLEARFFAQDSDEIITKNITSGTVSLAGLPTGRPFVVTIRGNNTQFNFRRVYIESLQESTEIYVLRDNVTTSNVVFTIDDPTGQFTQRRTILEVQKPITKDFDSDNQTETEYRTVAGDRFGTAGEFPTELQTNSRYRLVITSPDGETRELGGYQVKGSQRVELSIQSDSFDALPTQNGLSTKTEWVSANEGGPAIDLAVAHPDLEGGSVEISYRDNGTTIYDKSLTGNLSTQVAAANNSQYVVNISADIGDETVELQRQISSGRIATGGQVDNQWMQLFAMAALIIVGGLFTRANAGVGAIVTASLGGVFWFLELLGGVATGGMIVVALFIGVLSYAKRRGQGVAT